MQRLCAPAAQCFCAARVQSYREREVEAPRPYAYEASREALTEGARALPRIQRVIRVMRVTRCCKSCQERATRDARYSDKVRLIMPRAALSACAVTLDSMLSRRFDAETDDCRRRCAKTCRCRRSAMRACYGLLRLRCRYAESVYAAAATLTPPADVTCVHAPLRRERLRRQRMMMPRRAALLLIRCYAPEEGEHARRERAARR